MNDPQNAIWGECGPFSYSNVASFSDGGSSSVPLPGYHCWSFQYDSANWDGSAGCNQSGQWVNYQGNWGSASWGATAWTANGQIGAFSANSPWAGLQNRRAPERWD